MLRDSLSLYREARADGRRLAGYYNHNVRLDTPDGPVVVRMPIPGAAAMDLMIWDEAQVLAAVNSQIPSTPRLLHHSTEPPYQIHKYVDGVVVDEAFPRGVRLPARVRRDVVAFLCSLHRVPQSSLPDTPEGWPADGDTTSFAIQLSRVTAGVHSRYQEKYGRLFDNLGFPAEPLESVYHCWEQLASRPFCLVHADVHRKNMIDTGSVTCFLDWELALWGDPLYDLAVHIHKMSYQSDEQDEVVTGWVEHVSEAHCAQWRDDVDRYLHHEQVKSAIVDSVRYTEQLASGELSGTESAILVDKLVDKIRKAYQRWGLDSAPGRPHVEEVMRA